MKPAMIVAGALALVNIPTQAHPGPDADGFHFNHHRPQPGWVTGDFHQHSTFTDGSYTIGTVLDANAAFGLDWWANSEHGGAFNRDGRASGLDTGITKYWDQDSTVTILGDVNVSGGHTNMWRWQSIRDFAFDEVLAARERHPDKVIIQGLEWNVPGHEHCSVGIIASQFGRGPLNADPVAEFEYKFDNSDKDLTGGAAQGWLKSTNSGHAKAVEAIAWLQANYRDVAWAVPAHPERYVYNGKTGYNIEHFRDLNNAGPDVFFGFESMPGHQKASNRGEYGTNRPSVGGTTYGGCGAFAAEVGGLWDALLGEGRGFWLFANCDFHSDLGTDYWPGQYQKNHTYVMDKGNPRAIVNGLRSGNSFVVEGDLVSALEFKAQQGREEATMGGTLEARAAKGHGRPVNITIKFKSPATNNHGDAVLVDHIDLIAGAVTGIVPSRLEDGVTPNPAYTNAVNPTAQVIARFTAKDWEVDEDGSIVIHQLVKVKQDTYFRIRGTSNRIGIDVLDIDENGDPLSDEVNPATGDNEAWTDLWFYSNPIFVSVLNR